MFVNTESLYLYGSKCINFLNPFNPNTAKWEEYNSKLKLFIIQIYLDILTVLSLLAERENFLFIILQDSFLLN